MSLWSDARAALARHSFVRRADVYADQWRQQLPSKPAEAVANPLADHFANKRSGRGLWKWEHYLDTYDRHFARFRNRAVHVMEIGVYSGGSLEMWREYFGPPATLYGVDIEPAVKAYEGDGVRILVGDQGDRTFWESMLPSIPRLDIVIDDGGHEPHQQIVTLEALLPHMQAGGVYVCEDVHGRSNPFTDYVHGLTRSLHSAHLPPATDAGVQAAATPYQSFVHSIHTYPFMTVIEVRASHVGELRAPRRGTQWQPFYDASHQRPVATGKSNR